MKTTNTVLDVLENINEFIHSYECDLAAAEAKVEEIESIIDNLKTLRDTMENELTPAGRNALKEAD